MIKMSEADTAESAFRIDGCLNSAFEIKAVGWMAMNLAAPAAQLAYPRASCVHLLAMRPLSAAMPPSRFKNRTACVPIYPRVYTVDGASQNAAWCGTCFEINHGRLVSS